MKATKTCSIFLRIKIIFEKGDACLGGEQRTVHHLVLCFGQSGLNLSLTNNKPARHFSFLTL